MFPNRPTAMMRTHQVLVWMILALSTAHTQTIAFSIRPSPMISKTNARPGLFPHRHQSSSSHVLYLNANGSNIPMVGSLMGMFLPGAKKRNGSSLEAALVLTDKKRQNELKKDLQSKFPIVPSFAVDIFVDSMVDAFDAVAPSELQQALRPGGLEKARPKLEASILKALKDQAVVQSLPLSAQDKTQVLTYIVSTALDYALQDAQRALAEPSVKLQALEAQKREIVRYMSPTQRIWYRLRYFPIPTVSLVLLSSYATWSLYQQTKHTILVSSATAIVVSVVTGVAKVVTSVVSFLSKIASVLLGVTGKKGRGRRMIRR